MIHLSSAFQFSNYSTWTFLFLPFRYFMFTVFTMTLSLRPEATHICHTTLFVTHSAFILKRFLYCFEDICSWEAQTADEAAEDKPANSTAHWLRHRHVIAPPWMRDAVHSLGAWLINTWKFMLEADVTSLFSHIREDAAMHIHGGGDLSDA